MDRRALIYVAGHQGLVGSALVRTLHAHGFLNLVLAPRAELDLCDPVATLAFLSERRPQYVFLAAARVGGIGANLLFGADLMRENLLIQTNVLHAAQVTGVDKVLVLGSACAYPRDARPPMMEEHLLSGPFEPSNRPYAVAKVAALMYCDALNAQYGTRCIAAMPANLYGPGDDFDLETSHVIPALVRRLHEAKVESRRQVVLWGTGSARREFLFVDDLAEACLTLMLRFEPGPEGWFVNVGSGEEVSISELAELVSQVVGYRGAIGWDVHKPEGVAQRLLDGRRMRALGWHALVNLREGLRRTYEGYLKNM